MEKVFPDYTPEQRQELKNIIFHAETWKEMDRGTLSESAYFDRLRQEYPHQAEDITKAEKGWYECFTPIAGTVALMGRLPGERLSSAGAVQFPGKSVSGDDPSVSVPAGF